MAGVRLGNKDEFAAADYLAALQIVGSERKVGLIAMSALATQLAASGAIRAALDNLATNLNGDTTTLETWADLAALSGTRLGQTAYVRGDAGTHTDPVVGGTVSNSGTFRWSITPAGWKRNGALPDTAAAAEVTAAIAGFSSLDNRLDLMTTAATAVITEVTNARGGSPDLDTRLDAIEGTLLSSANNAWPDPFGEQIEDAPTILVTHNNTNSGTRYLTYAGVITRPANYASWGRTGLLASSSGLAIRRIAIADLGAVPGEQWTFRYNGNFGAGSNSAQIIYYKADGTSAGTSTQFATAGTITSGFKDTSVTVTIPADTAFIEIRLSGALGTKELLAVAGTKGAVAPKIAYPTSSWAQQRTRGSFALNEDPMFRLAAAGQITDAYGNQLKGVTAGGTGANTLNLVAAPSQSPFKGTKAVQVPQTKLLYDLRIDARQLSMKAGEPIYVVIGMVTSQTVQLQETLAVTSGTNLNDLVTASPDVAGTLQYVEVMGIVTPDANAVANGSYLYLRLSISGGVNANGLWIVGWSVRKVMSRLVDDTEALTRIVNIAKSAIRSPIAGETIPHFGDSIVDGNGVSGIGIPAKIAERTGAVMVNCGIPGTRMGAHIQYYDDFSMYKIADAIASSDWSAQIASAAILAGAPYNVDFTARLASMMAINYSTLQRMLISFGTNDFGSFAPTIVLPGTLGDTTGATFAGAIYHVINTIQTAFPQIQPYFTMPAWRAWGAGLDSDVEDNDQGDFLLDYVDIGIAMCERYHAPVLDAYRQGVINKANYTTYLNDLTHPNDAGMRLRGSQMGAFLLARV